MASAALSTRLTTTRLNCSWSIFTGGRPAAELGAQFDAIQAAGEDGERALHHFVEIAPHRLRRREAGELRKLVHQVLDGLHFFGDGVGAFPHDARGFRGQAHALQLAANALGAKARSA